MSSASNSIKPTEFTGLRGVFWPVHTFELKKFLPMGIMMACILFNYTILRDTKDTLLQFAPGGGAESFGFLKLYGVTPAAVLYMVVFAKMANALTREKLFYAVLVPFLIFFGCFGDLIYPNRDALHMSLETIQTIQAKYPTFHWFVPIIGNWSFSVFYIMSELWGSVILGVLFWQFANEITKVDEAKRFYGLFGMIGNVGLLFSGWAIIHGAGMSKLKEATGMTTAEAWGGNISFLMNMIVVSGLLVAGIYYWMNRNVLTDARFYEAGQTAGKSKKSKPKLSLGESFKYIISSPYLGLILAIVMAYGLAINLVEGVWKGQIKIAFPNPNDYNAFMGKFSAITGAATITLMILGNNILRRASWKTASIITPIMVLVTSTLFFSFIWYSNQASPMDAFMGTTLVMGAVIIGLVQNVLSKGTKYSLFDSTKYMAYIPLDQELKVKGQAAVEVIGGRGGKSGGALIQSTMLMIVGGGASLASLVHILGPIVIMIVVMWLFSVLGLSKRFEALKLQRAEEAKAAA